MFHLLAMCDNGYPVVYTLDIRCVVIGIDGGDMDKEDVSYLLGKYPHCFVNCESFSNGKGVDHRIHDTVKIPALTLIN